MLAGFLEEKYAISLARAVSVNPAKMENILSGEDEMSIKILNKIAAYFFIPLDLLIDDEKNLPELETLELDEDLLSVQRNDVANDIERMKQKHYISRKLEDDRLQKEAETGAFRTAYHDTSGCIHPLLRL